ncbi:MAG: hypothetical protein ABI821_16580 [Pseudomonadota bacterium]
MPTHRLDVAIRTLAGTTLLVALLAGCGHSATPEAVPAPPPAAAETPMTTSPDAQMSANPTEVPGAPAQPAAAAPPPQEPAATPTPAASNEPKLDSMSAAKASAKISVPVNLRYQFDGPVLPNQPVMLHLAVVPRVAGSKLTVSVNPVAGVRMDAAALTVQKVAADGVYRQQMSITAADSAPAELRVMVTMDMDQGKAFGFFTVPLAGGTAAQKQNSVKQR